MLIGRFVVWGLPGVLRQGDTMLDGPHRPWTGGVALAPGKKDAIATLAAGDGVVARGRAISKLNHHPVRSFLRRLRDVFLVSRPPLLSRRADPHKSVPAFLTAGACAVLLAFVTKAFYSRASATELLWILAPSSWLARFAGGIDLVYEEGAGFISHTHHLVVGPPCAGVNFLVICFLALYFSFSRHFASKALWLISSVAIAFVATVVANGLRIVVSAHLWNADIYGGWITPAGMHRLAGITIYYASLLALYFAVECCLGVRSSRIAPLLWYIGVSLGIPLAGRIYSGGTEEFAGHAAWVIGIGLLLTLFKSLPSALRNRIH